VESHQRGEQDRSTGLSESLVKFVNRTIFVVLLAMIVVVLIPYGTVEQWWEAVFECVMFALTVLWIVGGVFSGDWGLKKLIILAPLGLMTLYAFGQTVSLPAWLLHSGNGSQFSQSSLTIDTYQTHLTAVKCLALTLFTALLLLQVNSQARLKWLIRVVIGVAVASALFGILRQLLQSPESTNGFVLAYLFAGLGYAQFISPNAFAFLTEMAFGLVAGLLVGGAIPKNRMPLYLALGLIIWAGMLLSNSRGALLGFACQFVLLLFIGIGWYSSRAGAQSDWPGLVHKIGSSMFARLGIALVILAIVLFGVVWLAGERLSTKGNERAVVLALADGSSRKEIWKATVDLIRHNPWTGVGFGSYYLAITQYQQSSGRVRVEQAHNDYLDLAANGGLVAVLLAASFVVLVVYRVRSTLRSGDTYRRAAALGAVAGITSVAVHSLVDFGLQVTGIAVVFAGLVVIAVADMPVLRSRRGNVSETGVDFSGKSRRTLVSVDQLRNS
jgi:O-antigen ligase